MDKSIVTHWNAVEINYYINISVCVNIDKSWK